MLANVRKIFEISCDFIAKLPLNKKTERFEFIFTITSSGFVRRWATRTLASNTTKMNDFHKLLIVMLIRYVISVFSSSSPELLFKSNAFECQDACYCPPTCMLLLINGMVITAQVMPLVAFMSCFGIKNRLWRFQRCMLGESVPINFFYFVIFHVPFYMYVFLTK